jgi:hypothetical protein
MDFRALTRCLIVTVRSWCFHTCPLLNDVFVLSSKGIRRLTYLHYNTAGQAELSLAISVNNATCFILFYEVLSENKRKLCFYFYVTLLSLTVIPLFTVFFLFLLDFVF